MNEFSGSNYGVLECTKLFRILLQHSKNQDNGIHRHSWQIDQSILTEISPGCSLEGMILKLKLQYFGHLMRRLDSLEKTDAGRDWGQEEKGMTEVEMAGWHR